MCPVLSTFRDLTYKHVGAMDWRSHWQTHELVSMDPWGLSDIHIYLFSLLFPSQRSRHHATQPHIQ